MRKRRSLTVRSGGTTPGAKPMASEALPWLVLGLMAQMPWVWWTAVLAAAARVAAECGDPGLPHGLRIAVWILVGIFAVSGVACLLFALALFVKSISQKRRQEHPGH